MAAWLMIFAVYGHACTCGGVPAPQDEFQQSAAVFSGTVISISSTGYLCEDIVTVIRANDACCKGGLPSTVIILTPAFDGCCGYTFQLGMQYLVYARDNTDLGGLSAYLCTGTKDLAGASEDLLFLGTPDCTIPVQSETWGAIKKLHETAGSGSLD